MPGDTNLPADIDPCRVSCCLQDLLLALAIRGAPIVSTTDLRRGYVVLVVQLVGRPELGVGTTGVASGKGIARSLLGKSIRCRVAAASAQSKNIPEERPEGRDAADK